MSSNLSFSNVQPQLNISQQDTNNQSGIQLEGNLIGNARRDLQELGASVTTLVGGILGYDKEARQGIINLVNQVKDEKSLKPIGDMLLSTYNLTVDDLGNMPLGDMVGNIIEGIWEHPVTAGFDIASLGSSAAKGLPSKFKNSLRKADEMDIRIKAAEKVTQDNIRTGNLGEDFIKAVDDIEARYTPEQIGDAFKWIETRGVKNVPRDLQPVVRDLIRSNDTYKQLVSLYGAEILDDATMATAELLAKQTGVAFADILDDVKFRDSQMWKDAEKFVRENDIRPIYHLKPAVDVLEASDNVISNILQRKYGTLDYDTVGVNIGNKAREFVNHLVSSKVQRSVDDVNKIIDNYNDVNKTNVKKLQGSGVVQNNILREINSELKKTMLSSFTYLGANVLTTTLNILNNFDLGAAARTLKRLPKYKIVDLPEAQTPILNIISRINNKFSAPAVSFDRWLEKIASRYIEEYGIENAKYLQSTVPGRVVSTNPLLRVMQDLVPFGRYPAAAMQEVGATVAGKPAKAFFYNQIEKIGAELNEEIQEELVRQGKLKEVDPTKAVRYNENTDKLIQRSTVVTPIQAANMFLLGEYGDAIQIPVINFLNKLLSGEGDPSVFTVDGKNYRVDSNGKIQTSKGEFDLLPALSFIGRQMLSPVQFYNQVLVPLMSDKYIRDEAHLTNKLVDDAQYANMGMMSRRKVSTEAREKLGKRILGTYEYDYWTPKVSKRAQRAVMQQRTSRRRIDETLK